ncbi:uncharacterized protein LOC134139936 [Rhea pennata]|uniref:uncharacterized protein LOC134139936 n=1 Tax=Rhea pennata TaxID=8795 RepID=UPI002E270F51
MAAPLPSSSGAAAGTAGHCQATSWAACTCGQAVDQGPGPGTHVPLWPCWGRVQGRPGQQQPWRVLRRAPGAQVPQEQRPTVSQGERAVGRCPTSPREGQPGAHARRVLRPWRGGRRPRVSPAGTFPLPHEGPWLLSAAEPGPECCLSPEGVGGTRSPHQAPEVCTGHRECAPGTRSVHRTLGVCTGHQECAPGTRSVHQTPGVCTGHRECAPGTMSMHRAPGVCTGHWECAPGTGNVHWAPGVYAGHQECTPGTGSGHWAPGVCTGDQECALVTRSVHRALGVHTGNRSAHQSPGMCTGHWESTLGTGSVHQALRMHTGHQEHTLGVGNVHRAPGQPQFTCY